MWLRLLSPTFAFRALLCVFWDDHTDCSGPQSRLSESARARSQGFRIPADNLANELARVCNSVGKAPALRSPDAAFPSQAHFVMRGPWCRHAGESPLPVNVTIIVSNHFA